MLTIEKNQKRVAILTRSILFLMIPHREENNFLLFTPA